MCRYIGYLLVNLLLLIPSPLATVFLLSSIGEGATVYAELYKARVAKVPFLVVGLFLALVLYLGDMCMEQVSEEQMPMRSKSSSLKTVPRLLPSCHGKALFALMTACFILAWLMWVDTYPSAPLLFLQLLVLGSLLLLTSVAPASNLGTATAPLTKAFTVLGGRLYNDRKDTFYIAQVSALGFHGFWLFFLWLLWVADSPVGDGEHGWDEDLWKQLQSKGISEEMFGSGLKRVMLYIWFSPVVTSACLTMAAIVVMFVASVRRRLRRRPKDEDTAAVTVISGPGHSLSFRFPQLADPGHLTEQNAGELTDADRQRIAALVFMVKLLTAAVVVLFGCLWITASIVGSSLSLASTVQAFTLVFAGFLVVYVFTAIDEDTRELIARGASTSPLMKTAKTMIQSSWAKAMILGSVCGVLPFYVVLSFVNQLVRKCRSRCSRSSRPEGWLTAVVSMQMQQMRNWPWTDVHRKLQLLCMLAVGLQVVGGLGTNVFLAWVNSKLKHTGFFLLAIIFFLVGTGMFMIPIVPGIAVYLFGGILIPAGYVRSYGTPLDFTDSNFWVGFAICIGLNFMLKMVAIVLQQKGIGEPMSTNLAVLQAVGANTPQMKAIELILRRPGFNFPKIAILCGGPDWPTSVLTGILRLSLPQMLLCSLPVILNVLFVTSAGSFRLRQSESQTWSALSSVALTLASIWTVLQMALAAYYIQETWEKYHSFLSKPRKEHLQLDWIDYVTAEQKVIKDSYMSWSKLPIFVQACVSIGTALFLASSFFMIMLQSRCWDNFEVTDDVASLGLHFIRREGYIAIGVFIAACIQYFLVQQWVNCRTWRETRAVARKLCPDKNAWIEKRLLECKDSSSDKSREDEDLQLCVLQLRQELYEIRHRVRVLERGGREGTKPLMCCSEASTVQGPKEDNDTLSASESEEV